MALLFDGVDDNIAGTAPFATVPLTISCWFMAPSQATLALVAMGAAFANDRFQVHRTAAAAVVAFTQQSGANGSSTTGTVTTDTWHHIAGVFASSVSRTAYFNGVAGTTETTSLTPLVVDDLRIGARYATSLGSFHAGRIAEVGIWNVALSAEELTALAKGASPRLIRPTSRRFYARLVRTPQDAHGRTLTTTGTTVADHPRIYY